MVVTANPRTALLDLGVLLGVASVVRGCFLFSHALGYVAGGLLLAAFCFLSGYQRQPGDTK